MNPLYRATCLTAALALHEFQPPGESAVDQVERLNLVARILAIEEQTKQVEAERPTTPQEQRQRAVAGRAVSILWKQLFDEVTDALVARGLVARSRGV